MGKRAVQGAFESLWAFGFRLAGRLLRPRPRIVRPGAGSGEGRPVLVVAPHPDDEVAGCAGALLEHRRRGDRVIVACATDGRRSRAFGLGPDEMAARRRGEAEDAAGVLGVELEWLGIREGRWQLEELTGRLRELLRRHEPDLVYAPSRVDFHCEHERVARALAAALGDGPAPRRLRVYPVQVPLTATLANVVVPTRDLPRVRRALRCYVTQLGALSCCLRPRRYSAGLYRLPGPAEEFWQLDPGQYRRLHHQPPERPLVETFRGLRHYAWSDPLAYLRGLGERRRLASILESSSAPQPAPEP